MHSLCFPHHSMKNSLPTETVAKNNLEKLPGTVVQDDASCLPQRGRTSPACPHNATMRKGEPMLTSAERRSKDVEFPDALDQLDGVLAEIPSILDNDL